ncbi:MAG: polysaccharide deacetylase, partial [Coprobacillus sp.]
MKLKLKWGKLTRDICLAIAGIAIIFLVFSLTTASNIKFIDERNIEINSVVDYTTFIQKVNKGSIEDVQIDSSAVNTQKLGDYSVVFKYKDEEDTLKVKVVDTVAPEFEVVNQTIALNQTINPSTLVKNIKDATKTTVKLKNNITFNKEGEQEVEVVVTDEANNATT